MLEGKLTLPVLYALNSTKDKTAEEIAVKVKSGSATADEIDYLIEFAKQQGGIEYAVQTMLTFKEKALSLLASLPDSDVKTGLTAYLDYVVDRDKQLENNPKTIRKSLIEELYQAFSYSFTSILEEFHFLAFNFGK